MKGKQTFLKITRGIEPELFPVENQSTTATPYERKKELLIARYCFFIQEKKYPTTDQILQALANEFFISTYQVTQIIDKNIDKVSALRKQAPKKDWFKLLASHLVW